MNTYLKGIMKRSAVKIRHIIALSEHVDKERAEISIRNNIEFRGPNVYILAFAIVIASVGLNINSIPVIIGAMLVSPLMGPIHGVGFGLGINDTDFLKKSLTNLVIMVAISILASTLYFLVSPLELENPTELLARTNPTIYDVLIALFGGFAGIVEVCNKEKGTVISGVAIATALMPPLCTVGYGLATLQPTYFIGALYLFFINSVFIAIATFLTVKYLKFPIHKFADPVKQKRATRWISLLLLVIIAPSIWTAVVMIKENSFQQDAKGFINLNKNMASSYIYDYKIDHKTKPSTLEIFIAGEALSDKEKDMLYKSANTFGISPEQLIIRQNATVTQEDLTNRTAFQSIFERNDMEISKREEQIAKLKEELDIYKSKNLPFEQLTKEMCAQYKEIKYVAISRGFEIDPKTMEQKEVISVTLTAETPLSNEEMEKLKNWIAVRIDFGNIILTQE